MRNSFILFFLIHFSNIMLSQKSNPALDKIVQKHVKTHQFNGAIMVLENGKVIYEKTVGYANFKQKTDLDNESLFDIASCSKQFTALSIMILQEKGLLNYTDKANVFLADFPYPDITIHHLLTHTSGLPAYEDFMDEHWNKEKIAHNKDILKCLVKYPLDLEFESGTKYEYSNTGYAMLALIVETVSKQSFADFTKDHIFSPLDMERTRIYNTRRSGEVLDNYAYGYVYSETKDKYILPDDDPEQDYVYWLDGIVGDGVVNTNLKDLAKYEQGLLTNKIVKKSTLELAYTDYTTKNKKHIGYGYGVEVYNPSDEDSEKSIAHSGSWPGYSSYIVRYLDSKICIVILCNIDYEPIFELAEQIDDKL